MKGDPLGLRAASLLEPNQVAKSATCVFKHPIGSQALPRAMLTSTLDGKDS